MSLFFSGKCGSDPVLEVVARAVNKNTKDIEAISADVEDLKSKDYNIQSILSRLETIESKIDSIPENRTFIYTVTYVPQEGQLAKYILPFEKHLDIISKLQNPENVCYLKVLNTSTSAQELCGPIVIKDKSQASTKYIAESANLVCEWQNSGSAPEVTVQFKAKVTNDVIVNLNQAINRTSLGLQNLSNGVDEIRTTINDDDRGIQALNTYAAEFRTGISNLNTTVANITNLRLAKIQETIYEMLIAIRESVATGTGHAEEDIEIETETGTKTIKIGDVNGDGNVDITDVVALANHVMGDTPEGFVPEAADINQDGAVDITDIVNLANKVMGE